jgi:threonylcarbamoyladenosine tRNA methylthiotransferase MtaB
VPKKTFATLTLGCKVNQFDTYSIENQLTQLGYTAVDFEKPSTLSIINTCSVTHMAERKSRNLIRRRKKLDPHTKIVVTGCYAELEKDNLYKKLPDIDLVVLNKEKLNVVAWDLIEPQNTQVQEIENLSALPVRFNLKIQDGCRLMCTYCSIPFSRGKHQSTPIDEVVKLAHQMTDRGVSEIILTGVNIGAYGEDLGYATDQNPLIPVLEAIAQIEKVKRIRISSIELRYVTDDLIKYWMTQPKMMPHVHIPIQSANNKQLAEMRRGYTVEEYLEVIHKFRKYDPLVAINTDIMTGFPGETDEDFAMTLENVKKINFSRLHVFSYSKRKGTPAFKRTDQVAEEKIVERTFILNTLNKKLMHEYQKNFQAELKEILVEEETEQALIGYNPYYVKFEILKENRPSQ